MLKSILQNASSEDFAPAKRTHAWTNVYSRNEKLE